VEEGERFVVEGFQSLASLRQRSSQARVRSTIPALGEHDEGLGV
jgi:hypothetical protein